MAVTTRRARPATGSTGSPSLPGSEVDVVAPMKKPPAAGDRVKTDRKDAELLVRLLMAGADGGLGVAACLRGRTNRLKKA
jgi:transposase